MKIKRPLQTSNDLEKELLSLFSSDSESELIHNISNFLTQDDFQHAVSFNLI
jgi:hypothetical protein